jgi:hypothetical protein
MGEKSNHPGRKTASKRSRLGGDSATAGGKSRFRTQRVSRTKEKKAKRGAEERPVFVESVPPAMVAEVFEVAGADDDVIVSSMPPPPERHAHPARPLSLPPAPHPPRPSARPARADAGVVELAPDALELVPETLELAPEDLEPVESTSSPTEMRTALLTPLPTEASVRPVRPKVAQRAWLLVGGVALALGVAVGVRLRAAEPRVEAARSAMVRPRATATTAIASAQRVDVSAPAAPDGIVAAPDAPNGSVITDGVARDEASPASSAASTPAGSGAAPSGTANPTSAPARLASQDTPPAPDGTPFDTAAASAAITAAFGRAAGCRGPNDPTGSVTATLTYAPSGRVTTATVSGAFAGTPVGGCIASFLRGARVPPFSGERLRVRRTTELH